MHVQASGRKGARESPHASPLIFPRFHQWHAVQAMVSDARERGAGRNYLVEHSAGSGKSNTIAWLAHRLSNLFGDDNQPVFHKVIVITDRVVLDRQLQRTIFQFDHMPGVVKKIDVDSGQLAEALRTPRRRSSSARSSSTRSCSGRSPAPVSGTSGTR